MPPIVATDLTPLWASLGGGLVVGATTIIGQVVSNRGTATQSLDQREHEMVLDERRAVRSTRQIVYPKVTEAVREILTFFTNATEAVMNGVIPSGSLSIDSPKRNALWA